MRQSVQNAKTKTYNSGYSLVVTHLTTNPPVHCLSTAERTGSSVLSVLWSGAWHLRKYDWTTTTFVFTSSSKLQSSTQTMGQQPSVPKPGTKFQVIGAGLSRTGTASFSEALRILLEGPVYHGGTQATLGPEAEIRSWIKLLSHFPPKSPSDKKLINDVLKQRFDGYAAATDAPTSGLAEQLVELYPDAIVICTVRDPDAWVKSMEGVSNVSTMWFLRFVLFPLPGMRYFCQYISVLRGQWLHLYGETEPVTTKTHYNHIEYLKRVVPPQKLVFYSVKDGWEPLCKALGKELPDMPFPRINDGEAIDRLAKKMVTKGLVRWLFIFAALGAAVAPYMYFNR
ncbi:hypothetical protein BDV95DRAFT_592155 [Massariosphaeria phaeospora]|uniref:P-loop containing nucleoside triphosphate hydrolase protein n=1 Tax=Massariosphaeria phaeospora TaxID=100035 RepID=A0A7C8IBM4_9PLEO|nr:hypothetical protein BDV95DRAFT_592155 [Massariosphaeria phaeospora]